MICDIEDNYYVIFNHTSENLPRNGWIFNCILCLTITSRKIEYNYNQKRCKIFLCHDCIKEFDSREKYLIKKLKRYNYLFL